MFKRGMQYGREGDGRHKLYDIVNLKNTEFVMYINLICVYTVCL